MGYGWSVCSPHAGHYAARPGRGRGGDTWPRNIDNPGSSVSLYPSNPTLAAPQVAKSTKVKYWRSERIEMPIACRLSTRQCGVLRKVPCERFGRPYHRGMPLSDRVRRAIVDELILDGTRWSGRLEEPDFLARIYPMYELPSYDNRFDSAYRDVHQHRVSNSYDWDDMYVFSDERFQLAGGPDEVFLRFLAETVHPVVRPDATVAAELVERYNRHLRLDGYELHIAGQVAGKPVYGARSILQSAPAVSQLQHQSQVDASYLSQQITRMEAAILTDPELAIGTAKELVETVAKTILTERAQIVDPKEDLPKLVRSAAQVLALDRESIPESAKAADTIRRLLSNLATISIGLAELRNAYGTGHGRVGGTSSIEPRHARLAVGAAATLATFLLETHQARPPLTS